MKKASKPLCEKRYQVFISSTYEDLKEEREKVIWKLLELNCIPTAMEFFPATNKKNWEWIKKSIDESDYFIVIIGTKYGTIENGISYTEKEYKYALEKRKPILGFYRSDFDIGKSKGLSPYEKEAFKNFLISVKKNLCKAYKTADELASHISASISTITKDDQATGWVRGDTHHQNLHPIKTARKLFGTWNGEYSQLYKGKETTFKMKLILKKNEGSKIIGELHEYDDDHSFLCSGYFYSNDILAMEYDINDLGKNIRHGLFYAKLNKRMDKMEGHFLGYGNITKSIVHGKVIGSRSKN